MGKKGFKKSLAQNSMAYIKYFNRLMELSVSVFEWQGLPETVDRRYLEMCLFRRGKALFFKDDVVGEIVLPFNGQQPFDVYGIPQFRHAYSPNGQYQRDLNGENSVIIYNTYTHENTLDVVEDYARRLWEYDRIIDINVKTQKTPILVKANKNQILSMKNIYAKYDGNEPVIFVQDNFDGGAMTTLTPSAPFTADKINLLRENLWNERLAFLGIPFVAEKKERLNTLEISQQGSVAVASRFSRLEARRQACERINKMFNLNISVDYRENYPPLLPHQTASVDTVLNSQQGREGADV